jgi:hypothetical protein
MKIYLIVSFSVLGLFACDKSTRVSGKVTDISTGEPMEGVKVTILNFQNGDLNYFRTTGTNGMYSMESDKGKNCNMSIFARKDDCMPLDLITFEGGGDHVFDFQIRPRDAILELKIVNTQNTNINFYAIIRSVLLDKGIQELYSKPYPVVINAQDSVLTQFEFPGDDTAYLSYDLKDVRKSTSVTKKSFYVERNAKQQYEIRY